MAAISTLGIKDRDPISKVLFRAGWDKMVDLLAPSTILVYGSLKGILAPGTQPVKEYPVFTNINRARLRTAKET